MIRFRTIRRAAALSILSVAFAISASAQEVTLKFHHFTSPRGFDAKITVGHLVDRIQKESKGKIAIKVFPGMQLGGRPSDLLNQVIDGVVDIVYTLPGYTAGRFPITSGLELPFLGGAGAQVMTNVAWDYYKAYAHLDFKGFRVLTMSTTEAGMLHTTSKKVTKIADVKGLKIRVASRYIGEAVRELGGVPVQMPLPAVYQALSRGQVQGMMLPWLIMKPFKLYDVTKYHLDIPIYHSVLLQLIGEKSYQKLSPELRAVIDRVAVRKTSLWIAVRQDKGAAVSRAWGVKNGAVIYRPTGKELAPWIAKTTSAQKTWVREMNKLGYKGAEMLAFLKAAARKYAKAK